MLLSSFDYTRPATLDEALVALTSRSHTRALAGGQSLLNVLKHRAGGTDLLVDVSALSELRFIDAGDGAVQIGAATTYQELSASTALQEALPRVTEMTAHLVDVQVRNRGTIGGNCCYADPCSNFPPLLIALDARLHLASAAGERELDAGDFFLGAFRTALAPGELLRTITIPLPAGGAGVGYQSIQILPDSWALARAAAVVSANGTIDSARVVLGAVEPTPRRQEGIEALLVGRDPTPDTVAQASVAVGELPHAIADVHASAAYRRKLARVVAKRAIHDALAGAAS